MNADPPTCLRKATDADCELIFRWRNDPAIVALSQSRRPVDLARHRAWFAAVLADPDRLMLIIEVNGEPVGQLRFDRVARDRADITIYLVGDGPGHGYGSRAMTLGETKAMQQWPELRQLRAAVLASNARSLGYFAKMGFDRTESCGAVSDTSMVHLQKILPVTREGWDETKQRIAHYYDGLVGRYGDDPRSCDYGRATSQRAKFRAISQIMPLAGKRLLDVGCGLANFVDYLNEHGIAVDYHGTDVSEAMLARARARHPHLNLRRLDILQEDPGRYDVVTANGIFYLLKENGETLMPRLVARMYELADQAVAFNSLSSWATEQQSGEFYADPATVLNFCRKLTPWIVVRHDYLPHDFTVYLYREQR